MDLKAVESMDTAQLAKLAETVRDTLVKQADYEGAAKARELLVWLRDVRLVDEALEEQWALPPAPER